jgi:hypothetical protein
MQNNSPLSTAYNRLDEAHRAWHIALDGYHRIEDFRAGVNSALQAFQNLVYALEYQKEQQTIPGFDKWFDDKKKEMVKDPILKALHSGRVLVVHQEDLKLKSSAIARTKGWVDFEKTSFEFDPMSESQVIAEGFYQNYAKHLPVHKEIRDRLIFEFERKWVYDKLPDYELLEALAHTYKILHSFLEDIQQTFSLPPYTGYTSGSYCSAIFNSEKQLRCMLITKQERSLVYSFADGSRYNLITDTSFEPTTEMMEIANKKYGDIWRSKEVGTLVENLFSKEFPFNVMETFAKVALSCLKKDKYIVPITFIFREENEQPTMIAHTFENQESKVISIDRTANEIIKTKGKYVLHIGEVWTAFFDESKIGISPQKREDRTELIQIAYMSSEKGRIISIPFHKNEDEEVVFGETEVRDFLSTEEHSNYIFLPLIKALREVGGVVLN